MTREVHLALPAHGGDIYRRHQLVWRAMHARASTGREFIFRPVGDHLVVVRSEALERGCSTHVVDGRLMVSMVASARVPSVAAPLSDEALPRYLDELLTSHGFQLLSCHSTASYPVRGRKVDRETGQRHAIELPIRDVVVDVRITHRAKAELAWRLGIGRGKRFGFGMLVAAH